MSEYTPDRWVVIHIVPHADCPEPNAVAHYRVLAIWYGGYTQGESWRMNSGIVRVEEDDLFYHFYGTSGSLYHCRKSGYGMTGYGHSIYSQLVKNSDGLEITVESDETDFMKLEYT